MKEDAVPNRFGDMVGCGYCLHESTCTKRAAAMGMLRLKDSIVRKHFPNGGYTKYLAKYCREFELAYGLRKR